jgi:hypothetical protein
LPGVRVNFDGAIAGRPGGVADASFCVGSRLQMIDGV